MTLKFLETVTILVLTNVTFSQCLTNRFLKTFGQKACHCHTHTLSLSPSV